MNSNRRGFTLIELMVALTLLGVIATILASGTRLSLDISSRGNARAQALRTEQLQLSLIRAQLQGALPYHYWLQNAGARTELVAFEGNGTRVQFVSRDGMTDGPGSFPRWVDIFQTQGTDGKETVVVEERRVVPPDNRPSSSVTARTEISNCTELQLTYLDSSGGRPQWRDVWTGTDRPSPLPSAVRFRCRGGKGPLEMLAPLDYSESAKLGMIVQ